MTIGLAEAVKGTTARVTLPTGRTLEVKVPAGIEDGKQIRLKRQGSTQSFGRRTGRRHGDRAYCQTSLFPGRRRDLRLDLPVTLYEAVLGAKVNAPTLDGTVELAVPPGSNGGRTLRLRGKGLPTSQGSAGDLLVTLKIVLPDEPDPDLASLLRKWEAQKPYNPRREMK